MSESADSCKLNGSSGFGSYEESTRTESWSFSENRANCSSQNRKNQKKLLRKNGSTARHRNVENVFKYENDFFVNRTPPDGNEESASSTQFKRAASTGHDHLALIKEKTAALDRTWSGPVTSNNASRVVNYYKQFGDFWNKFPKTDYVYSRFSPWYGAEVAPGIPVIPNMSRRSYRSPTSTSQWETRGFSAGIDELNGAKDVLEMEDYEEIWYKKVRRIVITTVTTTVTTIVRTATAGISSASTALSSVATARLSVGSTRSDRSKLLWLLLLLLLLVPLLYCSFYGTDPPGHDFVGLPTLVEDTSALTEAFVSISRPFVRLWEGTIWLGCLLMNTVLMIPTLLRESSLIFSVHNHNYWSMSPSAPQSAPKPDAEQIRGIVQTIVLEGRATNSSITPEEENKLVSRISEVVQKMVDEAKEQLRGELVAAVHDNIQTQTAQEQMVKQPATSLVSGDIRGEVTGIVQELLERYHADRTGKTDFALGSNGAAIASIRCTKPYNKRSGEYVILGILRWESVNSPDIIIKPGFMPGECWAFEGANGYVAIQLAIPIYVTGFTMEHTPKELTPYGHIKSAPRKFSVWGIQSLEDKEEQFLGRFEFEDNGKSLQSYDAPVIDKPFHLVELRIESNHGHLDYTCLYRFRVHGRPID